MLCLTRKIYLSLQSCSDHLEQHEHGTKLNIIILILVYNQSISKSNMYYQYGQVRMYF